MGMGTATALHHQGFNVTGCDIAVEARDAFIAAGGKSVATPMELAHCHIVLVVVVNSSQVEQVLFGEQGVVGHLAPSSLIIQCATVAPSQAKQLGERVAAEGLMMLDAPISGGAAKAKSGELSVMASGAAEGFELRK